MSSGPTTGGAAGYGRRPLSAFECAGCRESQVVPSLARDCEVRHAKAAGMAVEDFLLALVEGNP